MAGGLQYPMVKTRPIKASEEFWNEVRDIKLQRIKQGIDKDMMSSARITRGMIKQPEWTTLKSKLIKADREDKRK